MATVDEKKRQLPPVTLEESYRMCTRLVRQSLHGWLWAAGNLPRETKNNLAAILALSVRSFSLCDIHIGRAARDEMLEEVREDLRNNLMDEEITDQYAAVVDTMRRFEIPQQYIHDIVSAADYCLRLDRFETFDDWLVFGFRLGGSTLVACGHVVQAEREGFESAATCCGQAIQLTHLLGCVCSEVQQLEFFMPRQDIEAFAVDLDKLNPQKPQQPMLELIRHQVSRIEKLFQEGGQIVNYLSLDGRRVVTTLISVFWHQLMKIKTNPQMILAEPLRLTSRDRFHFHLKHVLGIEGGVSVLRDEHGAHHH